MLGNFPATLATWQPFFAAQLGAEPQRRDGEDAGEVQRQADEEQAEERGPGAELGGEERLPGGESRGEGVHEGSRAE